MSSRVFDATAALEWSRVRLEGDDAFTFAQGQLSQDLEGLSPGAWTSLLAPDGAVVAAGPVSVREGAVELVLARELAEVAHARLARFVLRARCVISLDDGVEGPYASVADQLDARSPGPRELAVGLGPHGYGRAFVDATVSFAKGCFTGQELVGRLDARGANLPWRMVWVRGPSASEIDERVRAFGPVGPQGATTLVERDGAVVGLAIAHRTLLAAVPDEVHVEAVA